MRLKLVLKIQMLVLILVSLAFHGYIILLVQNKGAVVEEQFCGVDFLPSQNEFSSANFLITDREEPVRPEKKNEKDLTEEDIYAKLNQKKEPPLYSDKWQKKQDGKGSSKKTLDQPGSEGDSNSAKEKFPPQKEKDGKSQKKGLGQNGKDGKLPGQNSKNKGKGNNPFQDLKKDWGELLQNLDSAGDMIASSVPDKLTRKTNESVSDSYVNRKRYYDDIVVKEVFPTLTDIDKPFEELLTLAPSVLDKHFRRNEIIEDYRLWQDGNPLEDSLKVYISDKNDPFSSSPLQFKPDLRARFFDGTIKETKEKQLDNFINRYMHHNPNLGDLPIAVRELYQKNILRIAYPFSEDITFLILDYYQENLNKEDYLRNMLFQANRLMGSKTMTEILFTLESIYEIQMRGLRYYFFYRDNLLNHPNSSGNREIRHQVLRSVNKRYEKLLKQKKIQSEKDLYKLFHRKRLEIANFMKKATPANYRRQDIDMLRGIIYWQRGNDLQDKSSYFHAIQIWKDIDEKNNEDFYYWKTLTLLKPIIQNLNLAAADFEQRRRSIDSILGFQISQDINEKIQREKKLLYP